MCFIISMRINKVINDNSNINSQARLHINDKSMLVSASHVTEYTPLDAVFNENYMVKKLNDFSIFIKQKIICRYLDNPKTFLQRTAAKIQDNIVLYSRILSDRIFMLNNLKSVRKLNQKFTKIDSLSPEFIEELAVLGKSVPKKFIDINIEDKILENIAKSDDSYIFVMNHENYHKDKFVYILLNSFLSQFYMNEGKQATCPRPKILVSKNMLKILHKKVGNIYKNLGLVPVDASLQNKNSRYNANSLKSVAESFSENKVNLFIFPEGNNSAYIDKPIEERFQFGTAELIKNMINNKKNVKVVPIGIHYSNEKNSLGKVHIGKPYIFQKTDSGIGYVQEGSNINGEFAGEKTCVKKITELLCSAVKSEIKKSKNM